MRIGSVGTLLALIFIPLTSFAAEFRTGDQPSLSAGEAVSDDLYMAGGNVTSAGSVRGDLVAVGGNVLINGPVTADLTTSGGSVTILGTVGDDVRAAGGNVIIQGQVADDLLVGSGQLTIGGAGIGGDVVVGSGVVHIDAPVRGSVKIGGGDVYINSSIGGNVHIQADKVTLGPKTIITGDLIYTAEKEATIEEGAVVRGETEFTERKDWGGAGKAGLVALISLWFLGKIFMSLAGALVIALVFRRYARTLVETATAKPLLEIGRGLVFLIVTPVVSVILLATFVGVPFGLLGVAAYAGALIIVSMMTAPIVIGSMVHKWVFKPSEYQISWKTIVLGVAIYALLTLIPFFGWIVKFGAVLLTLGAMTKIKWDILKEWR